MAFVESLSIDEFELWHVGCWGLWNDHNTFCTQGAVPDIQVKCCDSLICGEGCF